ncbi:MAG: UvrD-helicase domain-containing protein [Rhodoferax sp.]
MTNAIAIDSSALDRLQAGFDFDLDWFTTWSEEPLPEGVARVEVGDTIYLLGPKADADSNLLVVEIKKKGLFDALAAKHRPEAFLRLVRLGRSEPTSGRHPLPISWSPYHAGSLVSFRSNSGASGELARIEVDLNPHGTTHAFAYNIDRGKRDLYRVEVDYTAFDAAVAGLDDAVIAMLSRPSAPVRSDDTRVELPELANRVTLGRSLDAWLDGLLTQRQLDFVKVPLTKSLRLVGAAGTGKTLSLVVKCVSELRKHMNDTEGHRSLFLTHSQATVELITQAIASMDHEGILARSKASYLKICTLQELANEAMKYDLDGLEPLSSDGLEGRALQLETIEAEIERVQRSDWVTAKSRCSEGFRKGMSSTRGTPAFRAFAREVANEIACVLEADGVRQSAQRRERYLNEPRKAWMMYLPDIEDRRVILMIYDRFRTFLKGIGVLGTDQMIADYLGFLDSNRWDNIRHREGFDTVFVDELHLFNRQERMTLHHLMRDDSKAPVVIMAYDSKQSVRDTFNGLNEVPGGVAGLSRDMRLGETERFELTEGFRYTPEIARVLEWIDQGFPAAGISEELGFDWRPIDLGSMKQGGARPILVRAKSTLDIWNCVFPRAHDRAKSLQKGRRVAVLCASEALFKRYSEAGEYRDWFLPISDREQLSGLRHAGKRFVFSMPDFVAGVQFDTVYLIEVNDGEVEEGPYSTGSLRRFVSTVYLGASRAEQVLEIYSSEERGGPSRVLRHAINNGALDVIDIGDLH